MGEAQTRNVPTVELGGYFLPNFLGGVGEPVLFGFILKYKKPLIAQIIGGGTSFSDVANGSDYASASAWAAQRFTDASRISSYAVQALNWAVESGVLSTVNGAVNPQGQVSSAQLAQMVYPILH